MRRALVHLVLAACLAAAAGPAAVAAEGDVAADPTYIVTSTKAQGLSWTSQAFLASETLPEYGPSYDQLSVQVTPETATRLHVTIRPAHTKPYEVPETIVPRPGAEAGLSEGDLQYSVDPLFTGSPLELVVSRAGADGSRQVVFDTSAQQLAFKEQYIELTTRVPADADLYGLGEVTLPTGMLLPRDGTVVTLWARDVSCANEGANLYGAHPFYLQTSADGSSHGVLFLNSHGMDVLLNATSLTYRVIGGVVDLYFFMGPSPEEVIRQYHQVIGAPALPPYWSLGLHQSKWGYANLGHLEEVVGNYSAAGLPLEVIWSDIDYMAGRFQNAAFNPVRFPADRMSSFVDELNQRGQHWVPIIDAGVAMAEDFHAYNEGEDSMVWVRDASGRPYVGQVWPGQTVYPDYLANTNVSLWLQRKFERFYEDAAWSGLWLDMNEASNFCSGSNCQPDYNNPDSMMWLTMETPEDGNMTAPMKMLSTCVMKCDAAPPSDKLAHPPYRIHNFNKPGRRDAPLSANIIAPSARHADGAAEYSGHNMYGTAMARSHYEMAVAVTQRRPFLLTRSTFPGAGRYAAHWTGDNAANWENLYYSVAGVVNSNLWGMPMAGADICGFIDATQDGDPWTNANRLPDAEYEQLCARWASAGAFYPFSRNHMGYPTRHHEYYRWPSVTAAAKKAYDLRYRLLTYLYGALFLAHSQGGTVARPLYFSHPADAGARNASAQWMLGEGVLVSPVVKRDADHVQAYFTAGAWYSAWNYEPMVVDQGRQVRLHAPLGDVPVHYRGGAIVPLQRYANVTRDVRFSPVTLVVALPAAAIEGVGAAGAIGAPLAPYAGQPACRAAREAAADGDRVACGHLFMDSEADEPMVSADNTVQVWFTATAAANGRSGTVSSDVRASNGDAAGRLRVAEVHVLGAARRGGVADEVTIAVEPFVSVNGALVDPAMVRYDPIAGVLRISGLDLDVGAAVNVKWAL